VVKGNKRNSKIIFREKALNFIGGGYFSVELGKVKNQTNSDIIVILIFRTFE